MFRAPECTSLAALAAALVAAAPAHAAAPARARIALVGVTAGEGISDKTAAMVEELLLNALDRTRRFSTVGRSDIANLIGFERQRQLAGCEQSTSCVAEIAGALGVPFVGSASLGRLGALVAVSFKVIEVSGARVVARGEARVQSDSELPDALDRVVAEIVGLCESEGCFGPPAAPEAAAAKPPAPAAVAAPPPAPAVRSARARTAAWVLLGAGALAAVAGGVLGWQARDLESRDHTVDGAAGTHSLTRVEGQQAASYAVGANVLFGAGALLGVGGAVAFAF